MFILHNSYLLGETKTTTKFNETRNSTPIQNLKTWEMKWNKAHSTSPYLENTLLSKKQLGTPRIKMNTKLKLHTWNQRNKVIPLRVRHWLWQ